VTPTNWHSFWHAFSHAIWHMFLSSIWQPFWHLSWHFMFGSSRGPQSLRAGRRRDHMRPPHSRWWKKALEGLKKWLDLRNQGLWKYYSCKPRWSQKVTTGNRILWHAQWSSNVKTHQFSPSRLRFHVMSHRFSIGKPYLAVHLRFSKVKVQWSIRLVTPVGPINWRSVARSVPLQTKELSALPLYGTSLESAQKGWVEK
jgi:hypothetical protein